MAHEPHSVPSGKYAERSQRPDRDDRMTRGGRLLRAGRLSDLQFQMDYNL